MVSNEPPRAAMVRGGCASDWTRPRERCTLWVMTKYISNNSQIITTDAGRFSIDQRNVGYADNDGRWVVVQLPENEWRRGTLYKVRHGGFLGSYDTEEAAKEAISEAPQLPKCFERAMLGRVSC